MTSSPPKYHGWLLASIYNGLQKLSVPIFGVISTMLLAHKALTKQEMGVWSLFLVVTSFVELIRQALVKTSLIRHVNHSTDEEHKYVLSAALFLNIVITSVLLILLLVFSAYFSHILEAPQLESMIYIFSAGMILLIPFSHFEWIMYGKSQFKGLFWTFFFRQGISLLLMVIYLALGIHISLDMLVIFYCAGILAGTIVAYYKIRQFISKTFTVSKEWLSKLWHFGKYVFGSGVSTYIFGSAGQMMLSPILGSTVFTASQNVAMRVINLSDIPGQVLSDILFPKSAKKESADNKELIKYYYEKTVGATLSFVMPMILGIILLPKLIIFILAGRQYYDAIPFLQLVSITGISGAFLKQWGVIIDSTGRPRINFIFITFIAIVHVVFTYFFIKAFGLLGAAYALLCSHGLAMIIIQVLLYRFYSIRLLNSFKYAMQFYPEFYKLFLDKLNSAWKKR